MSRVLKAGDFLVSRGNGSLDLVGRGGLVATDPDPVAFPDTMIRVRPNSRLIEPRYLALAWTSPAVRAQIEDSARTTAGIYKVNQTHLGSVVLALPPLDEQRRIVDLLEDHLSRLDAANAYLRSAHGLGAVLHDQVLSFELNSVSSAQASLGELLRVGLSNGKSVQTREGGFPVLRLTALRDGCVDLAERKPGAWTSEEASRFLVQRGDFLIARGNGSLRLVGRGGLVMQNPDPVALPDTLIRARPDTSRVLPEYLAMVWNAPDVRQQIERHAKTTAGIYKVNQKDLSAVRLAVPSLADQGRIIEAVQASRDSLGQLSIEVTRAGTRSNALRRSLLSAAFSGRLTGAASGGPATAAEELAGV